MFINCSNHASVNWSEKQLTEAGKWGKILDYPFPNVDAEWDEKRIEEVAQQVAKEIKNLNPSAVMCQGEFTLTFQIVKRLKELQIPILSACSERKTIEYQDEDKKTRKIAEFSFVKFREY